MNLTILGSTGSIGVSTLDVVRQHHGWFEVYALIAGRNTELLCSQILEFHPKVVVVGTAAALKDLQNRLVASGLSKRDWPELAEGSEARVLAATASEVGFVMSAIVGIAGLEATYAAIRNRKRIGL